MVSIQATKKERGKTPGDVRTHERRFFRAPAEYRSRRGLFFGEDALPPVIPVFPIKRVIADLVDDSAYRYVAIERGLLVMLLLNLRNSLPL